MIKQRSDFNPHPDPYCVAIYDPIEKAIVCYEHTDSGTRRLTGADRMNKPECVYCQQLTEAVDLLMKDKKLTNGRWR
jgi:hypothetical protein